MTVDLMHFPKMDDQKAIQEAASQGLQSMEQLISVLSTNHPEQHNNNVDCSEITDLTVSKFKTVISLLNRTGHARFRRGPVQKQHNQMTQVLKTTQTKALNVSQPSRPKTSSLTLDFTKPTVFGSSSKSCEVDFAKENFSVSLNSSYMSSAITGDGSVSKGSSIFFTSQPGTSSGKPPLAGRKRCLEHEHSNRVSGKTSGSRKGDCHCKRNFLRSIRVPAISSTTADIPSDEFSWRKYGQKPIKGSPYPRGYYRCSMFKDCPARKHVERALDDPSMLIVTYQGEHRHENVSSSAVNKDLMFASA